MKSKQKKIEKINRADIYGETRFDDEYYQKCVDALLDKMDEIIEKLNEEVRP